MIDEIIILVAIVIILFATNKLSEKIGRLSEATRLMQLSRKIGMPIKWRHALFVDEHPPHEGDQQ